MGGEGGAKNAEQYLRKADKFAKDAKKEETKSSIRGEVKGVIRYTKTENIEKIEKVNIPDNFINYIKDSILWIISSWNGKTLNKSYLL